MSTLNAKVILNVKTAAEWANSMEILLEGELGIESDTRLIKIGNGTDTYPNLPYTAASDINDIEGVTVTNPTDGNVLTYSNGEWVNITPSSLPADTDLSHYDNTTSGFITASDIPALPADTDLSHYDNTNSDFATVSQIPTDVSQLNNDAGYITSSALPSVGNGAITIQKNSVNVDSFTTNQNTNKTINITVPTLLSELSNDVGYITSATIPTVNNGSLIIRQDGNIIATFTANSATNVVANITSGGGGGGGASYTSQLTVDSSLIPDTDSVYNLGDSTHRWTYLYSQYLSTGDGSALIAEQSIIPTTDATYNLGSSGKAWRTLYASKIDGDGSSIETSGTIYPSVDEMDSLGGNVNKWSEIHTEDLLVYGDTYTDTLKAKTTSGDITIDTNLLPSSTYNLGSSVSSWSFGYIDSVYATNIKLTGALTVGIPSDTLAYKRITIKGYDGNTEGTLTDWALLGWVNTGVFGFRPVTSNTGTIGTKSEFWNNGYFTNLCTTGIYSKYDPNTQLSSVGLFYNTHVIEVTPPVQWGYMGQKSASEIGIFPLVGNTYLGSSSNYWTGTYSTAVHFSTDNIIADDPNSTGLYIGWKNSSNVGRYVRFADDAVSPVVSGMTLGSSSLKWNNIYTDTLTLNGTSYTSIPIIPTGTIGAAYYNLLGTNSNGNVGRSSVYFSGGDLYLSSTVKLRAESNNTGEFYWYNTVDNESAALQLAANCVRAYSGAQAGKIDLGNQHGYWRDLYLGIGRSIYFVGGSSINDTTGNTLDFHATSQCRFYLNNEESIYLGGGQFTPTSSTAYDLGNSTKRWNTVWYTTLNPPSDIRLKENIEPLESGLKIVNDLDIKSFTFKNSPDHIEYGIIAQEVVEKYPELISVPDSEEGTYGTYLHNFIFVSLRAIQELSSKVDELNAKIKVLEGRA